MCKLFCKGVALRSTVPEVKVLTSFGGVGVWN